MGIFSAIHDAILGPSASTDTDLARNLQERGIVDTQGKAVADPSLVAASRTPEAKKQALEGQQAVERQVGYGVQENLDNVNQVASTIKKVASVPIPVPSAELIKSGVEHAVVSVLPAPFATIAHTLISAPKSLVSSVTPAEVAKMATDVNMTIPKIATRTALEFAPPGTAITPKTPEEKFLFGNEPITAITKPTNDSFLGMNIGSKTAQLVQAGLEKLGVPESPSRKIAGVGTGMFAAFVNNPFVGGEKKAAEETLSEIANLTKGEEILPKLQSLFHGADTEILKPLAEKLTEISDVGKVKETITSFLSGVGEGAQKTTEPLLNLDHLNIDEVAKKTISDTVEAIKPEIQKKVGTTLSNDEVKQLADQSSEILNASVGKQQTKEWEAGLLNLREKIAEQAKSGTVTREFIDDLVKLKSNATDIGRKLQSFSIDADPAKLTPQQLVLDAVLKTTDNIDEVLKAAEGVDFNDANQATTFYRKFIQPKAGEWLDLVRYNSMLSSPNTHINNIVSNAVNTAIIAPIEKAVTGGIDFLKSTFTGSDRKYFVGEAGAYLKGYFSHVREATQKFTDVMSGENMVGELDMKAIPIANEGIKGTIVKALSYPMKLLEGADQFFSELTKTGELGSLNYKTARGVDTALPELQAEEKAAYRLFRQPLKPEEQGHVLDTIDTFTAALQSLRSSKNPIVSTIAKFTVPFLRTPMNIFKQGIEYSPLGFTTLWGSKNQVEQFSKAIIGSSVAVGAATLLSSGRLTWSEPKGSIEKTNFLKAGRQAYSIRVGDKWISYQKLAPAFAFPIAMISMVDDTLKNKKTDDKTADLVLGSAAKYMNFLSDQSYAKSFGDLITMAQKGEYGIEKFISNYPKQLIPYRALSGWFARLFDDTQRRIDDKADFVDKQIQLLMQDIPFVSKQLPARLDYAGNEIKKTNNVTNAFSPAKISNVDQQGEAYMKDYEEYKKVAEQQLADEAKAKNAFMPTYKEVRDLIDKGHIDDAQKIVNGFSDEQYKIYQKIKESDQYKKTVEGETRLFPIVKQVQQLTENGRQDEAQKIVDSLSEEDYRLYRLAKKKIIK